MHTVEKHPKPFLFTKEQSCMFMNCSGPTLMKRAHRREIECFEVGGRKMFCPTSMRRYLRSKPLAPKRADSTA